jgi:anthranilate 1,2-dioxygenase reductase component
MSWHQVQSIVARPVESLVYVRLTVPESVAALFTSAGQYLRLRLRGFGEVLWAMASAPLARDFEFVVKRGGSFINALLAKLESQELEVSVPTGNGFPKLSSALLFATGTGMAPMKSFLSTVPKSQLNQFELWLGARSEVDIPFETELVAMARLGLDFRLVLSQPTTAWTGLTGYISEYFDRVKLRNAEILCCGQNELVDAVRNVFDSQTVHLNY